MACSSLPVPAPAAPTRTCAPSWARSAIGCRPIFAAFGLPEPAPDQHLRVDEERVIRGFLDIWHIADPGGDADVRVARLAGETSRRLAEGWLDVWDATARPALAQPGRSWPLERGRVLRPVGPGAESLTQGCRRRARAGQLAARASSWSRRSTDGSSMPSRMPWSARDGCRRDRSRRPRSRSSICPGSRR